MIKFNNKWVNHIVPQLKILLLPMNLLFSSIFTIIMDSLNYLGSYWKKNIITLSNSHMLLPKISLMLTISENLDKLYIIFLLSVKIDLKKSTFPSFKKWFNLYMTSTKNILQTVGGEALRTNLWRFISKNIFFWSFGDSIPMENFKVASPSLY